MLNHWLNDANSKNVATLGIQQKIQSPILFFPQKESMALSLAEESVRKRLRFGLLPGIQLKNVYKASWVVCHGTDFHEIGVIVQS